MANQTIVIPCPPAVPVYKKCGGAPVDPIADLLATCTDLQTLQTTLTALINSIVPATFTDCNGATIDPAANPIATCSDLETLRDDLGVRIDNPTVALSVVNGVLTSAVNSASASITGELQTDAFGVSLGYLLPL